jgi:hypothetical protein
LGRKKMRPKHCRVRSSTEEKTEQERVEFMKKLFLVLAILLLAAPAMAAITISGTVNTTTKTVDINYSGDLARAYALEIEVDSGTITAVDPCFVGEGAGYGIFMGTIQIDSSGTVTDDGTPVAPNDAPDANGTGIGTSKVILEMGSLYETTGPASSGTLCRVTVSECCTMTVSVNTTRGAVVLENATAASTNLPLEIGICATEPECYTGPQLTEWRAVGSPPSWCIPRQCHGDSDDAKSGDLKQGYWYVGASDLNNLGTYYKILEPATGTTPSGPGIPIEGYAADFDHAKAGDLKQGYWRVGAGDLNVLAHWYKVLEPATGTTPSGPGVPADCNTANPAPNI